VRQRRKSSRPAPLDLSKKILDREKGLLTKGYTTQETVDRAEKEYAVSLSNIKLPRRHSDVKEKFTKEEIDAAVAKVEQAKASLRGSGPAFVCNHTAPSQGRSLP
jgi:multidrug resistance efflux pump